MLWLTVCVCISWPTTPADGATVERLSSLQITRYSSALRLVAERILDYCFRCFHSYALRTKECYFSQPVMKAKLVRTAHTLPQNTTKRRPFSSPRNALKLAYSNVEFKKNAGNTPGPLFRGRGGAILPPIKFLAVYMSSLTFPATTAKLFSPLGGGSDMMHTMTKKKTVMPRVWLFLLTLIWFFR